MEGGRALASILRTISTLGACVLLVGACARGAKRESEPLYDVTTLPDGPKVGAALPPRDGVDVGPVPRSGPSQTSRDNPPYTRELAPNQLDDTITFKVDEGYLSQLEFAVESRHRGVGAAYAQYVIEVDFEIKRLDALTDEFTLFLDTPTANRVTIRTDGDVQIWRLGTPPEYVTPRTNPLAGPTTLRIDVNMRRQRWAVTIDDERIHAGPIDAATLIDVRLSLHDREPHESVVHVSSVRIGGIDLLPTE